MIDLNQAEKFFASFTVRDRKTNRPVPFRLNPSQQRLHQACKDHMAKGRRLFVISLKGRRLGISTWARLLMQAHLIEKPFSDGLIMGQLKGTSRALYEEFHKIAKQMPISKNAWKYTQAEINFWNVPSKLSWQTAGSVVGTRGLGFTLLHATEAAFYENPDVFPAVFSTLSDDPENMAVIESTPNGKEGPGQAYYELWQATVAGDTEYLASFLPWHEDPDYIRDPRSARDAPRDDYEKFLMKELKLGLDRVAFYRVTLNSKCGGSLERWRKEYPGNAEEAFAASGDPVFSFEDLKSANKWSKNTRKWRVEIDVGPSHQAHMRENSEGRFVLFEHPVPGAHYFAGVIIGHSDKDDDGPPQEDMLAMIVWNGETGVLAGRMHIPLRHAVATQSVYAFGCLFNRAMIAAEDGGGGFGMRIYQELRDRHRYPNQYKWKGRNDKADPMRSTGSVGFSITDGSRRMMLNTFLTALKRGEVIPCDEAFTDQMEAAQWKGEWIFDASAGIDDLFYAGALGWIAKDQWHPQRCKNNPASSDQGLFEDLLKKIPHQVSHFSTQGGVLTMNLQHHLDELKRREQQHDQEKILGY